MVNEEDHLRMQMMSPSLSISQLWKKMDKFVDTVEEAIEFAFDKRFGYLTACPTNAGTGLRASVMLHLPALNLTKQMEKIYQAASKVDLVLRGFFGEGTAALGDLFQVSNQITLGKSERELVMTIESVVKQILQYERQVRESMRENNYKVLQTHFADARKALVAEDSISNEDALTHLSAIRMGVNMSIIEDLTSSEVDQMLLFSHSSHLQKKVKRDLSERECNIERVRFFKEFLGVF